MTTATIDVMVLAETPEVAMELAQQKSVTLINGDILRCTMMPDMFGTISDDPDVYGEIEAVTRNRDTGEQNPRPANFNGAAEILCLQDGAKVWWQPPIEAMGKAWFDDENLRSQTRSLVRDILNYGFSVINLELCRGTDAYGKPIVIAYNNLPGVEPFADNEVIAQYIQDLIPDLPI